MRSKKSSSADLNKKSTFYLAIGLFLVLLISWRAIEWKNYDDDGYGYIALDVDEDDDEEIPITEQLKTPPPPPPPPAPEIIEVVEDEEEIEETIIESTETDQEEIVEEVEVMEEELDLDVPFAIIEDVPLFPGCERVPKSQRRACFQTNIQKHINKNFRYPEIAQEMGIQGRVFVQFIIDKDGSIVGIRTRGPHPILEIEAKRIISRLPKFIPALDSDGKAVKVPFSVPITFNLQK